MHPQQNRNLPKRMLLTFTPKAALNRLSKWITTCEPLMKALKRTGYSETQKKISGRQKWLIYKYLGSHNQKYSLRKSPSFGIAQYNCIEALLKHS